MIDGVRVERLEGHEDERGRLVPLFREDDPAVPRFGQVHLTTVHRGAIKGWRRHRERTDCLAAVRGTVRVGLYDARPGSPTEGEVNEFFIGERSPLRLTIPPGVWFGLKGVGEGEALVVVLTDRAHDALDPDEERLDPHVNEIPFDWERRDR